MKTIGGIIETLEAMTASLNMRQEETEAIEKMATAKETFPNLSKIK